MYVNINDARSLSLRVLQAHGLSERNASVVTEVLIDAHCTGHTFAGLPRIPVLLDSLRKVDPETRGRTEILKETDSTAWIDGQGNLGYITCQRAIDLGIEKSRTSPVVLLGAFNSHYSGRLGFYAEQAAAAGLIVIHANSTNAAVAAPGGNRPVLGTNPFCVSLPTSSGPVTVDFGTSAITQGEVLLAATTGEPLPEGVAVDANGAPTTDGEAASAGAILPWGGHKGFGMSIIVAALGVMAGGAPISAREGNDGYVFLLMRADHFLDTQAYERQMDVLLNAIKQSSDGVRIPGERSAERRRRTLEKGEIEVPVEVLSHLESLL